MTGSIGPSAPKAKPPVVPIRGVRPPPRDRLRLGAEILTDYRRARRLMRTEKVDRAVEELRSHTAAASSGLGPDEQWYASMRLGRAVGKVLALLPTDRRCLVRSLTLTALLARRGIPARMVLGTRPDPTEPFLAHAWVELDGVPVTADEGYNRLHDL